MPRYTSFTPTKNFHFGHLIYAGYARRTRVETTRAEVAAKRLAIKLDKRRERRSERREVIGVHIKRKIDKLEMYPSRLAVKLLQDLAKSRKTPAAHRARASAILLRWANGDFTNERRKRQKSRTD